MKQNAFDLKGLLLKANKIKFSFHYFFNIWKLKTFQDLLTCIILGFYFSKKGYWFKELWLIDN